MNHCRHSSEWQFHRDIYLARDDAGAIVHTHSVHATALACLNRGTPAFHYMVAAAGGHDIRCAPYGTQELSNFAAAALAVAEPGRSRSDRCRDTKDRSRPERPANKKVYQV